MTRSCTEKKCFQAQVVEDFRSKCGIYAIPIEQKTFPLQGPTDNMLRFPNNISRGDKCLITLNDNLNCQCCKEGCQSHQDLHVVTYIKTMK